MKDTKSLVLPLFGFLLFAAAYYPVLVMLAGKWAASDDYTHAFFTLPIILYMGWQKRAVFAENQDGGIVGLLLVICSLVLYLIALQIQVPTIMALVMVFTIAGSIYYLAGLRAIRALIIPLLLLVMLIPIPVQLLSMVTITLQLKVSQISDLIIQLVNVPLYREGNVLHIPNKSFEVVEACSGIRSLVSLTTLSLIMGYFTLERGWTRLFLMALSIPTAVFVNIVRVVSLVLAYHFFGIDLSAGTEHTTIGLVVFGIGLAILFLFQRVLESWEIKNKTS